jgi:malate dehydrogenase (oxaloacetate-decarboxylating)
VVFAGINAALQITKTPLKEVRFLVYGAGSAGCGIAQQIANGIAAEYQTDIQNAYKQITCIDKQGVLTDSMDLSIAQKPFARAHSEWDGKNTTDLKSIVAEVKPHVLIGTSTIAGAFSEPVVKEMHKHVDRPIILPLSNPTRLHEAKPVDLIHWTDGKALIATGSPFDPVDYKGQTYEIGECNNSVCFPGIGLACVLSKAKKLTDEMLMAAIKGMASKAPVLKDEKLPLVPDVDIAREVSVAIAASVIREAKRQELIGEVNIPDGDLESWVEGRMWEAEYPEYEKVGDLGRAEI